MPEGRFTLLYDGECPFCRREVEWLRRRDREGHLALEDIADPGFDPAQYGLTRKRSRVSCTAFCPMGESCVASRPSGKPIRRWGWVGCCADAMAGRPLGARRYVRHLRATVFVGKVARQTVRERQMYDHARTTASRRIGTWPKLWL